jgi:hypothetical protein
VVEHEPTWGKLLVGGVQVDKVDLAKIRDDQREGALPGLTDALRKAAEQNGQDGCVLRIDRFAAGWIYFSLLHTIEASPLGKQIFLDTAKGVVRIEQTPPKGRTIVARLDNERFVRLISEHPFGSETLEEEERVERRIRSEEDWFEMDGLDLEIAKHWRGHAKGAKRLMIRVDNTQPFSDLAAVVRALDRARRELPVGDRFEIGIAPLIERRDRFVPPPSTPVRLGPVKVLEGKRDPATVLRRVQQSYPRFRECYDDAAAVSRNVRGKGVLTLVVLDDGQIVNVLFEGSLVGGVASCLREAGRGIHLRDGTEHKGNIEVEIEFTTPDGGG